MRFTMPARPLRRCWVMNWSSPSRRKNASTSNARIHPLAFWPGNTVRSMAINPRTTCALASAIVFPFKTLRIARRDEVLIEIHLSNDIQHLHARNPA